MTLTPDKIDCFTALVTNSSVLLSGSPRYVPIPTLERRRLSNLLKLSEFMPEF